MTVKEYLKQIYWTGQRIKQLQEARDTIKSDLYSAKSPNYVADRVQSSVSGDTMERLIAQADELTHDIEKELERRLNLQKKIIGQINRMPARTEAQQLRKACLYNRYVLCHRWEVVADEMNVSLRYVYMIHGDALEAFKKLYPKTVH